MHAHRQARACMCAWEDGVHVDPHVTEDVRMDNHGSGLAGSKARGWGWGWGGGG